MKSAALALVLISASGSLADVVVPVRTIRAREIIVAEDVTSKAGDMAGFLSDLSLLVGLEARVALYPGRPIRPQDVAPPAIVGRNDLVILVYRQNGLHIATEGRALGRGAAGEIIRAMNLTSRATITGRIQPDGSIEVRQ